MKISQRTAKISLLFNVILIVISLGLFFYAFTQQVEADKHAMEAEMQRNFADSVSVVAFQQREIAVYQRVLADSARMEAIKQRDLAIKSKDSSTK